MPITLKPDQQAWLERQVNEGHLSSVDDGVAQAVADMMAIETDDMAWAKSYVDEARKDVAQGAVSPAAPVIARLRQQSAS